MSKSHRYFLLLLLATLHTSCSLLVRQKFHVNDRKEKRIVRHSGKSPSIYHIPSHSYKMRVLVVGDSTLPVTLLIHGSPGSIATFNPMLTDTSITNHTRLIAIDRPGYGYSNFGRSDTSIADQCHVILDAVQHFLPESGYNVIGFSYGGAIAATISGMDSCRVNKLVLASSSLAPGMEKIYSISYMIENPLFRPFFSRPIRVANDEKLSHRNALETVVPWYHYVQSNVLMFHGLEDPLIYPENTRFAEGHLTHAASFTLKTVHGSHHIFLWKHKDFFKQELKDFLFHP